MNSCRRRHVGADLAAGVNLQDTRQRRSTDDPIDAGTAEASLNT